MNEFLQWLSGSIIFILALLITYFIIKNALAWSSKSPKDIVFMVVSLMLVIWAAQYVVVPTIETLYLGIRGQVAESQVAADLVSIVGVAPADVGVGDTASQQVTIVGAAPSSGEGNESSSVVEEILSDSGPDVTLPAEFFVFPRVDNLTLASDTLSVENPNGVIETYNASDLQVVAACGWVLSRVDHNGNPTHLLACPASELRIFSAIQVILPSDFPMAPPIPTPAPTEIPAAVVGQCWTEWAITQGLPILPAETTEGEYKQLIPAGTTWTIVGPSGLGRLPTAANESWLLKNEEYSISLVVNRHVGVALGGAPDSATRVSGATGSWATSGCK